MLRKLIALALFCILILSAAGCKGPPKPIAAEKESENHPQLIVSETENQTNLEETPAPTEPVSPDSSEPQNTSSAETSQTDSKEDVTSSAKNTSASEDTKPPTVKPPVPTDPPKPKPEPKPTTPTVPPAPSEPEPPKPTEPPTESTTPPPDMEKEYKRIIREATAYAESYAAKGFSFVWDDSLKFDWETGYMGTPRVEYEGVDGVIAILKHHIDLIVKTATDPANGIPGHSANYKVMQVTVDGDIAFVVLYG